MTSISREEARNVRLVEAFVAAQKRKSRIDPPKLAHNFKDLNSGPSQTECREAPCFVATEHDLMNLTEYLQRLSPAVIEAGIIKISVPEELRVKFLPCSKPSHANIPCKEQIMRYISKHEEIGSANMIGYRFGKCASTTIENMIHRKSRVRASLGIQQGDILTSAAMEVAFWQWVQRCSKKKYYCKGLYASDIEFNASRDWAFGSLEDSLSNHNESLLRHNLVGKIPGLNTSMIYVGSTFSFFPWHYEDNMLYSLNYLHEGDSKTWYGVAVADAPHFESVISKKLFPEIVVKQPHHVWAKSCLVEPSVLVKRGVKVVSCIQNPGDFVLTSPGGYHQGFCHGYCFAEALNWAPLSWLPYGIAATKFYRELAFPASVISTDKLLLSCARELVDQSPNLHLLAAVGTSASTLLCTLLSHIQTLSDLNVSVLKYDPCSINEERFPIRCDYCQHVCHIAHAVVNDPKDSSCSSLCCLDHLVYQRDALNIDLGHTCVHLHEDLDSMNTLLSALNRQLSDSTSPKFSGSVRPYPIIEFLDDSILQNNKRKARAARLSDSNKLDSTAELHDDPSSIIPISFQNRPFLTALRMKYLRKYRVNPPNFFEGSSSIERISDFMPHDGIDGAVHHTLSHTDHFFEKSIDPQHCSNSSEQVACVQSAVHFSCSLKDDVSPAIGFPNFVTGASTSSQSGGVVSCSSLFANGIIGSSKKRTFYGKCHRLSRESDTTNESPASPQRSKEKVLRINCDCMMEMPSQIGSTISEVKAALPAIDVQ